MAEELSRTRPTKPARAEVCPMTVRASERISEGFVRITLVAADGTLARTFEPAGYDQWFRLFLPTADGSLNLPLGGIEGWYARWQAMSTTDRPVIRNYTVRQVRTDGDEIELDVDFVVHLDEGSGRVAGVAAQWALSARPGDGAGLLDQGRIYAPAVADGVRSVVLADETGVPGAEGIARSLAPGRHAVMVLEVSHPDDRRPLPSRGRLDVVWVLRPSGDAVGRRAVAALGRTGLTQGDQLYAVGEASMVLAARDLATRAGLARDEIDFCAYWRPSRRAA